MAAATYDITLTIDELDLQIKLNLYRPESGSGSRRAPWLSIDPQPLREGEQFYRQEQRALYADASGGAGYGERLAPNVYHQGLPADARMPGIILPPGRLTEMSMSAVPMTGPVYCFIDAFTNGGVHTFGFGNRYAFAMAFGVGNPAVSKDFGSGFTAQSAVYWYSNLIVGGIGGGIWKLDLDAQTWSQSSEVGRQYIETTRWTRGGSDLPRLVGSTVPTDPTYQWPDRSFLYTDNEDPMTEAVWSEEIFVGDTGHSITNIVASNRKVYFLKSNGVYAVDDRLNSPNITDYRKHVTDVVNPMAGWISNGYLHFGSRTGQDRVSLARDAIRQDVAQRCEFGYNTPNYGPIRGIPTAGINADGGSYVTYWNATSATTYLCWQADWADAPMGVARPPQSGPLLHHGALAVLPGIQILTLHLSAPSGANYAPRLLLGGYNISTGLGTVHWFSLPQAGSPYQDLRQGGPMRFADEMVIDFPRETYGSDVSRKDLTRVSIRGDNLGTATLSALAVYDGAAFDTGTPVSLGQATSAFGEFAIDSPTNVRDLTFRVTGNGTSTIPPILRALEAQAGVSVEANTVHTYICTFGGDKDRRPQFELESQIEAIRAKRGTLTDHRRNREYSGRVLQDVSLRWEELPSGEKTGRAIVTIPFLASQSGWQLDTGRHLDMGLRLG